MKCYSDTICFPVPGTQRGPQSTAFSLGPLDTTGDFDQAIEAWDAAGNINPVGVGIGVSNDVIINPDGSKTPTVRLDVCPAQNYPAQPGDTLVASTNGSGLTVVIASVTAPGTLDLFWSPPSSATAAALQPVGNRVYHAMTNASYIGPITLYASYDHLNLNGADPSSLRLIQMRADGSLTDVTQSVDAAAQVVKGVTQTLSQFMLVARAQLPDSLAPQIGVAGSGLSIASDAQGRLWEINVTSTTPAALSVYSSTGGLLAQTPLPANATPDGNWSVTLDNAGNAYAVGTVFGGGTTGTRLAVLRFNGSDALVSSAFYTAPVGGKPLPQASAFDGSGNLWIVGALEAVQTGANSLALWQYQPQTGALSLAASYTRAGADVGFAVMPASGAVWVAGYSGAAAISSNPPLDLALWRFNAQTGAVLGPPSLLPHVLAGPQTIDFGVGTPVQLAASGDLILAAAQKSGASGETDVGLFVYDSSGVPHSESAWIPAKGSAQVMGSASQPTGFAISGQLVDSGQIQGALWSYDSAGNFLAAQAIAPAQGAAYAKVTLSGLRKHYNRTHPKERRANAEKVAPSEA